MTAPGITYFEKASREENIDNCQQIGVKLERTFTEFVIVNSVSGRLSLHFVVYRVRFYSELLIRV